MEPLTTRKSLDHAQTRPGHEPDPKLDNPDWYFIKCKEGEDDGQIVGTVMQTPKSYLEHKTTWLPCDGQKVRREEYPELEAAISNSVSPSDQPQWFVGMLIQIPNLNGVAHD